MRKLLLVNQIFRTPHGFGPLTILIQSPALMLPNMSVRYMEIISGEAIKLLRIRLET